MESLLREILDDKNLHLRNAVQFTACYYFNFYCFFLLVGIAIAVPNLGPFMSLVGAVCLSTLGLIFPAIIELVTYWERPGLGAYNWRLWKNIFLISFGVLGFCTGLYTSLEEIIATY